MGDQKIEDTVKITVSFLQEILVSWQLLTEHIHAVVLTVDKFLGFDCLSFIAMTF